MGQLIRPLLIAIVLLVMAPVVAQELALRPKWKRDDTRTLYLTQVRMQESITAAEGDVMPAPRTYKTSSKVKVFDITPENVFISIDHENVVLPVARSYFDGGVPAELDPYKRMIIRYSVDRNTGASQLMNDVDLREFAQRAADISIRAVRRSDPEKAALLEEELKPIVASFTDPALAEHYFEERFGFLTHAFGKPLNVGEPMVSEGRRPDPYGAAPDSVQVTTTTILESHSSDQSVVKVVRSTSEKPKENTGKAAAHGRKPAANDTARTASWKQEQWITLDEHTTWPVRMVMNTHLGLTDGNSITEEVSIEVR